VSLNAEKIGEFCPESILKIIQNLPPTTWNEDTFRSGLRGLEATKSIMIQYDTGNPFNTGPNIEIKFRQLYDSLDSVLCFFQSKIGPRKLVRVFVANLPPGARIGIHKDPPEYSKLLRYHWVLSTNGGCQMIFRRKKFHFGVGEIWAFNNQELHAAENLGGDERLHMIFDFQKA
jgi:hypothetical protein